VGRALARHRVRLVAAGGLLALSVGTVSALVRLPRLDSIGTAIPLVGTRVWPWAQPRNIAHRLAGALWIPGAVHFPARSLHGHSPIGVGVASRRSLLTSALGALTTFTVAWPQAGAQGRLSAGVGLSTDWDNVMRFGNALGHHGDTCSRPVPVHAKARTRGVAGPGQAPHVREGYRLPVIAPRPGVR